MDMQVKVPRSLQGGSLLDAHRWVKSQMARSNPGGGADYSLVDSVGNPMTLSDIVRNNPADITVEIISGVGGVRSNPSLPLPADFVPSPDFARAGNFSNQLLPRDLDPALVERMVAQEGVFGAVNTLSILLTQRSAAEGISPTTAGLLYAHSAIPRENPGGKTPFLADAPKEMYDSEIMIHRYLDQHGINDIEKQSNMIKDAKMSAKYNLTQRNLDQFVTEVLAPFLGVASGNRGALRTINKISAGMSSAEKKEFANNFGKLMYLMPTKAEDFMKGREYGLVASTEFIYPVFAMRLLSDKDIDTLLEVAKKFPNNLAQDGKTIRLTNKQAKLIKNRTEIKWKTLLEKIPYIGGPVASMAIEGDAAEAKAALIKGKVPSKSKLISYIIESVNADSYRLRGGKQDSTFFFMRDIGGFYPSPPKTWPLQVCYAVMDAFLESLPDLVDIRDPLKNYESKISMEKLGNMTSDTRLASKDYKEMIYKDFTKTLTESPAKKETFLKGLGVSATDATAASTTPEKFSEFVFKNWSAQSVGLEFNADLGKSALEFFYDVVEIAKVKYDYEMTDDDMTFALTLIDYSIKKLFDDGASVVAPVALMTSIFGRSKAERVTESYERLMGEIASGRVSSGSTARAAILHLSSLQGIMDMILTDDATYPDKRAKQAEVDVVKRTYPPVGIAPVIAELGKKIIKATEDVIKTL